MSHSIATPHPRESERNQVIEQLQLDRIQADNPFRDVLALLADLVESPICLFSIVYRDQQIFHACVGADIEGTPRDIGFCPHAILEEGDLMEIPAARHDTRFKANPMVTGGPRIQSYFGRVIRTPDGLPLGTICLIDRIARKLSPEEKAHLDRCARITEALLAVRLTHPAPH